MSKNQDTYEMLDASPAKSARGKLIGVAVIAIAITGAALIYFFLVKDKKPVASEAASSTSGSSTSGAAGTPAPSTPAKPSESKPSDSSPPATSSSVSASETVHFAPNRAEVLPQDASKIETLWSRLKSAKGTLVIDGYADSTGPDAYNQGLSKRRAESVAAILKRSGLKDEYKVSLRGLGESQPIADNSTEAGRASNRRAVLSFNK